ncbi:MAG: hypothetical protein U9R69_02640 [Thermodesulfobacteriota bacterium]|nr:hypothetical protein [Thermodesulfobacteriota bacterium]
MKRPTLSLARKLLRLSQGEKISQSQIKAPLVKEMVSEGVLSVHSAGTRKKIYCHDTMGLTSYLRNRFGINDLASYIDAAADSDLQRSEAVRAASDSKLKRSRSCKGFLVNCCQPLSATLHGEPLQIAPTPGTFTYIHDFEDFIPAPDVVIVGVENSANFRYIERQQSLFPTGKILFVNRYPQSGDLIKWLQLIPNRYFHFGDFDFAGINIYLYEFKPHLGLRAQFFLPDGVAKLFQTYGNRELYQRQLSYAPSRDDLPEADLKTLWDLICAEKKGLEQEVLIGAGKT